MGTMGMFSASLGLNCTDCHVEESGGSWARYADETELKRTTRRMVAMVNSRNKSMFGGRQAVTCFSCHRGINRPRGIPDLTIQDRKSTRLNSSHSQISYAVFCVTKTRHT